MYMVRLLRHAYITKEAADELYEFMKASILDELAEGRSVNLFGIVNIKPYKLTDRVFTGFINCTIHDVGYRLKATINRTIKDDFRNLNRKLGGKLSYESSKLLSGPK